MATINGTDGPDTLIGTADADTINGFAGNDTITGLAGADVINAGPGNDIVQGGAGADTIDGGTGVDTLIGGPDNDTYLVDDAADQVIENANEGTDTVNASNIAVSYALGGGQSIENLIANGTADVNLTGNEVAQTIIGSFGNNVIDGGLNAAVNNAVPGDVLSGRLGNDTYLVRNAADTVLESADQGTDIVYVAESVGTSYTLQAGQAIESLSMAVQASSTAFNLTGNDFAQVIAGNQGANVLTGGGGVDTLIGLGGNDTYVVSVVGTVVTEVAGGGDDTVNTSVTFSAGTSSIETINATGAANINLTGSTADQALNGNAGNNILSGGGGNDTLTGNGGNDTYVVDGNDQVIEAAGEGTDTVITSASIGLGAGQEIEQVYASGSGFFTITGARNPNFTFAYDTTNGTRDLNSANTTVGNVAFLNGNAVSQQIWGDAGANILDGMRGNTANADTLAGLAGDDTYRVYGQTDIVLEDRNGGVDRIYTSADYSLATNDANSVAVLAGLLPAGSGDTFYSAAQIEFISTANQSGTEALNIEGNQFGNFIVGNYGNNTLTSGGTAAGGTDALVGLRGNDTYIITDKNTAVFEYAGDVEGADVVVVNAGASGFTLNADSYVETIRAATGTDAIAIVGNNLSQRIEGNDGDNLLSTGGGAIDTLAGGLGNDTYRVYSNGDVIIEDTNGGALDRVFSVGVDYRLGAGVHVEYLGTSVQGSSEPITFIGNQFAQVIQGNYGNNVLDSGQGAVTGTGVYAQTGDLTVGDTMQGLVGNDSYRVYSQNDVVIESAADQGTDTILTVGDYNLTTNDTKVSTYLGAAGTVSSVEVLQAADLQGTSALVLVGDSANQTIIGNAGQNTLDGGSGNDVLTGGAGSDTFGFTTTLNGTTNVDSITDFQRGDLIGLSSTIFANATDGTGITADEFFVVGSGTQTADQVLVYNQTTGQLYYDADGSGSGAAVLFATLAAGTQLGFNDFVVYNPAAANVAG